MRANQRSHGAACRHSHCHGATPGPAARGSVGHCASRGTVRLLGRDRAQHDIDENRRHRPGKGYMKTLEKNLEEETTLL